jgi:hypothetical protein
MKKWMVILWLGGILTTISYLLWHEDWKYSLPTPVPEKYLAGRSINGENVAGMINAASGKPFFIHFFNPSCPCSRFNIPHFRSLVKKYGHEVDFAIVVMSEKNDPTAEDIREKFELELPVFFDRAIADSCGVYSTPQAVLVDAHHQLYYRGNYNKSRFCEDKNTNYAQMALDSLLANSHHLITDRAALKSYGCSLPGCKK